MRTIADDFMRRMLLKTKYSVAILKAGRNKNRVEVEQNLGPRTKKLRASCRRSVVYRLCDLLWGDVSGIGILDATVEEAIEIVDEFGAYGVSVCF